MIPRFILFMAAVASLGLAGCQTDKPIAMNISATPTTAGITHGDVLAPQRAAGQDVPALKGNEIATVRTYEYVQKEAGGITTRTELEGIQCKLDSDGYTASVKTPAQVRVPDYGYASRPISVECMAPGYRNGVRSVAAVNKSAEDRMATGGNGGLAGVVLMAVVNAASDQKKDKFVYPQIHVTMNRVGCEQSKVRCR